VPEFPDLPDVSEIAAGEERDRFGQLIAIATVLTTLAAALVAFLQATAVRVDDESAVRAERLTAQALGTRLRSQEGAQLQYERFELAEQHRRRAGLAQQGLIFGSGGARELRLQRSRDERLARRTEQTTRTLARQMDVPPVPRQGRLGPDDPTFPNRYFAASRREAYRLGALRDAENAEGDRAEEQFTAYAVSLTMLAVAVFLFGYSLTPQGRPRRRLFAGTATAFVAVAGGWALLTTLDAPEDAPPEAATAFADGRVALDTGEYRAAQRELSRAIELRPDYAQAYTLRAEAISNEGSAQTGESANLSVTSPRALERSIADLERARELGTRDPQVAATLGFDYFVQGLRDDDEGKLEQAVELSREAEEGYRQTPIPDFNEAVALLALGRTDEARAAYDRGIKGTVYADERHRKKRDDVIAEQSFLGGALTDLELLAASKRGRDLAGEIRDVKQRIVAPVSAEGLPSLLPPAEAAPAQRDRARVARVRLAGAKLEVTPADATLTAPYPAGFDPTKDRVSLQWYRFEPSSRSWVVVSAISGNTTGGEIAVLGSTLLIRRTKLDCLRAGRYRAEVYVNGRPAGEARTEAAFDRDLEFAGVRDVPITTCRPRQWAPGPVRVTGFTHGYQSPDRRDGVQTFAISRRVVGGGSRRAAAERAVEQVLDRYGRALLRGAPGPGRGVDLPFMGLEGAVTRTYGHPGGRLLIGAGVSRDGEVLVGLVWGTPEAYAVGDVEELFRSLAASYS
jgi:tetratricopeptide (TPR) repeat protein